MSTDDHTTCGHCGQRYPMPDLAQVLYHEQIPHRPIVAPRWSGSKRVDNPAGNPNPDEAP